MSESTELQVQEDDDPFKDDTPEQFGRRVGAFFMGEGGKLEAKPVTAGQSLAGRAKGRKSLRTLVKSKLWYDFPHLIKVIERMKKLQLSKNDDIALRANLGFLNWLEPPKTADIKVDIDQRRMIIQTNADPE